MDADFSIELGREDPVLDFPWTDPAGKLIYLDLKRRPELLSQVEEAEKFPELREVLRTLNSARSVLETAKCDAWATTELSPEEDVYDASHKFASYVDVVFCSTGARLLLPKHQEFVAKLVELLRRAPETPSAADVCVRRCYFAEGADVQEGLYCTLYVNGYGKDEAGARQNWAVALSLMGAAVLQLSAAAAT